MKRIVNNDNEPINIGLTPLGPSIVLTLFALSAPLTLTVSPTYPSEIGSSTFASLSSPCKVFSSFALSTSASLPIILIYS